MKENPKVVFLETCTKCRKCGFIFDGREDACPRCGDEGEELEPVPGMVCKFCGGPVFEGYGCGKIECADKRRVEQSRSAEDMPEKEIPF